VVRLLEYQLPYPTHDNPSLFAVSPGRFFAANEVKALLAHMVVTYDMKIKEGKGVPPDLCIAGMRIPGRTGVMFRKRLE
jgi:hypothetical protein